MRPFHLVALMAFLSSACSSGTHGATLQTTASSGPYAVSSIDDLQDALGRARLVEVSSYLLPERMSEAVARLCRRGGASSIVLARPDYDPSISQENADTVATLNAAGCHAEQVSTPLHLKTMVLDGKVAYVSDTNFSREGFLLRITDPSAISLLRNTISGNAGKTQGFATDKGDALALESGLLQQTSGPVCVSTESFGNSPIAYDLYQHASQVRLVVAAREADRSTTERELLQKLQDTGHVVVRLSNADEKIAAAADLVFLGSANATAGYPEQTDWGLLTNNPSLVAFAKSRCEQDFDQGQSL